MGLTADERTNALPGDDLFASPDLEAMRAITVHARPDEVWPWIFAQMGQGRGGLYSYDALENLVSAAIRDPGQRCSPSSSTRTQTSS